MIEFPSILNVKNKDTFKNIYYNRILCYLRKTVYEHVIREDENNYFDIDSFTKNYFKHVKDLKCMTDINNNLSNTIMEELRELGWSCKLSFGGTGLFIYSSDKPPPSCWDDGLI